MRTFRNLRTATSAKAKLAVALVSVFGVLGATGALLLGASAKFTVSASPATQTVTAGQSTSFAITVARQSKFTSPVSLSVSGLPAGATRSFSPSTIPGSSSSSTLNITTAAGTPAGNYTLTVTGTAGSATSSATVRLTVLSAATPNFSLSATPASGVISADDAAYYTLRVNRTGGFTGPVALSVSGLPKGVTAQYESTAVATSEDESTLELTSDSKPKAGNYTLAVTGTGQQGSSTITRSTSIQLIVEEKKAFGITGDAPTQLVPGEDVHLDLALTNPHNFALQITELHVAVDANTSKPGCSGIDNYEIDQLDAGALSLPAGSTQTLSALGVAAPDLPTVRMVDSVAMNQDACKGATVFFDYSGAAIK